MEVIGFQPEEISATLELLASILNLGNVTFVGKTLPDGTDSCSITDMTCKYHNNTATYIQQCSFMHCTQSVPIGITYLRQHLEIFCYVLHCVLVLSTV